MRSKSYRKVIKKIPLNKLMLETDSPWMAIKKVEDGTMWIVNNNKSLFSYKDNTWTFYGEENFTNRVLCLEQVDNKIILGTDKGLEFLE